MSNDVHSINGLGKLMNVDNMKTDINITNIEKDMINSGWITNKVPEPEDVFQSHIDNLTTQLGFDLDIGVNSHNKSKDTSTVERHQNTDLNKSPTQRDMAYSSSQTGSSQLQQDDYDTNQLESGNISNSNNSRDGMTYLNSGNNTQQRTIEQEKYNNMKSTLNEMGIKNINYTFDNEKREDAKSSMLEEIDFLRDEFMQLGLDITRIPHVTQISSYEEIESILRLLRHKSDRIKYGEFAESFLMMSVYAIEELFNGKRDWFGYSPDLTGWSNNVEVKLRRMRHETSTLVSNVMNEFSISPATRILLELVPNAIIYSRTKKQSYNTPSLNNDARVLNYSKQLNDL